MLRNLEQHETSLTETIFYLVCLSKEKTWDRMGYVGKTEGEVREFLAGWQKVLPTETFRVMSETTTRELIP